MVNKYMLLLVASVIVASLSQILLKKSASKAYTSVIREYLNAYVIIGYGMMVLSTLLTVGGYAVWSTRMARSLNRWALFL